MEFINQNIPKKSLQSIPFLILIALSSACITNITKSVEKETDKSSKEFMNKLAKEGTDGNSQNRFSSNRQK